MKYLYLITKDHNHLGKPNNNSNQQFVNRWIINNVNPPRPAMNFKQPYRAYVHFKLFSRIIKYIKLLILITCKLVVYINKECNNMTKIF